MAAKRTKSRLAPGTSITDYASASRIRSAFGSEKAIREEYSRQRSIIRKRIERMSAAGETSNWLYNTFGDLQTAMPSSKGLSTETMMQIMASSSRALSGAYQSTLTDVVASRKDTIEAMKTAAEEAGDDEFAALLDRGVSAAQWKRVTTAMGMIQRITGRNIDSETTMRSITEAVLTSKSKRSVLSIASQVINDLGLGDVDAIEKLSERFTASGSTRVSWSKAHKQRR